MLSPCYPPVNTPQGGNTVKKIMIEIAKFTFPKILKTGDIIESEPYNCQKLNILGLSIFTEQFLYKDLSKLLRRTLFHFFVDGKIYPKLPLFAIPHYPCFAYSGIDESVPFYDLRTPAPDKTMNNRLLPLLASEVMCKLEIINNIKYNNNGIETFDIAPFEMNQHSVLYVHLIDSLMKKINNYNECSL